MIRNYIIAPPGVSPDVDAYNLLLASMRGDSEIASAIAGHQERDATDQMLATAVAWLAIILRSMPSLDSRHLLAHMREIAEVGLGTEKLPAVVNPEDSFLRD
jgi:hypothetical protein